MRFPPFSSYLLFFFCALHVLAISTEAIPQDARDPVSRAFRQAWQPLMRPYIRVTAQWQSWNLFAPDPLREVVTVFVDIKEEGGLWEEILVLGPGICKWPATSCGGWRETALLKVARAFAEEFPSYDEPRETFLRRFCALRAFTPGTHLRLRVRSEDLLRAAEVSENVRMEFSCP